MQQAFKGAMAEEITAWEDAGLINAEQARLLHGRYDPRSFRGALILKWLGLFAIFMLGMSFLGVIGSLLTSFSPFAAAFILLLLACVLMYTGGRLAADRAQKNLFTAQTLLSIGLLGFYSGWVAMYFAYGGSRFGNANGWFLLITSAAGILLAYRFHLRWPLLMGLLMFFHGIGGMSRYGGFGNYYLSIQDPRSMAMLAVGVVILGIWHEQVLEVKHWRRNSGFGGLYLLLGLLYLNLSLWILSLDRFSLIWVTVLSLATIGQIIAGARFKDSRLTGFGIVFLGINLYTRFYEFYWDSLSKALFFTLAGLAALAFAAFFEQHRRRVTQQ